MNSLQKIAILVIMQGISKRHHKTITHIITICVVLLVALFCVIPVAYGIDGFNGIILPSIITLIYGYSFCARRQYLAGFILSLCIGIFISLVVLLFTLLKVIYSMEYYHIFYITFTIIAILGVIAASTTLNFQLFRKIRKDHPYIVFKYFGYLSTVAVVVYIIASFANIDDDYYIRAIALAIVLGLLFGFILYNVINRLILPEVAVYETMISYLKIMLLPVGAFIFGYFILILIFAGFFTLCHQINPEAFTGSHTIDFNHFIYYSVNVITTLGASELKAHSSGAKFLEGTEVILGMMWVTVILAAAISHFQVQFNKIRSEKI